MKRTIELQLKKWLDAQNRQPLILFGARQVGKTYSLKQFGKDHFNRAHYFNFEEDPNLATIFEQDFKVDRIISALSFHLDAPIEKTDLIIFDEIQECSKALTALKYFAENRPGQPVCAAGSLMGVKVARGSFPVGKVQYLWLRPMTFREFLLGIDDKKGYDAFGLLETSKRSEKTVHDYLWQRLKEFYVTGGLPRAVLTYQQNGDSKVEAFQKVRTLQAGLVKDYISDFAKHSGKINAVHIQRIFENVPMQLSRYFDGSVKRYKFKEALPNKKGYAQLAGPIEWLVKSGLVHQVKICNRAEIPLESFCKENRFRLYLFDVGLLGCMLQIPPAVMMAQDYGITKGYFAENFVAQALLHGQEERLYGWQENQAEIEFLKVMADAIIPIEVKAGTRTQAKSLKAYRDRYDPPYAIKISGKALHIDDKERCRRYPLYMAECL